jgi:predicted SnoaL-like aldol condensation-catalyzing enzyme
VSAANIFNGRVGPRDFTQSLSQNRAGTSRFTRLLLSVFDTLFNKRDYKAAETFWSPDYIQHSANVPQGRSGLSELIKSLPLSLKYEHDVVMTDGDLVMLRGRFAGTGLPADWIAADIVRLHDGRLVEHWDVLQDEATKASSKSGLPMFGTAFPA